MTSSLVGSEMCIRDSGRTVAMASAEGEWMEWSDRGIGVAGAADYVEGAVSYTHLTLPTICSV
eukprot:11226976-Prorocentrum_lima.AAC.1